MGSCINFLLLLPCLIKVTLQVSTASSDSYVAAVLEYSPALDTATNLRNYLQYIEEAASKDADIVVFPEMTLNRFRDPIEVATNGTLKEHPIPALNEDLYHEVLVNISKAARENSIYVVINIEEVMYCNTTTPNEYCPKEKVYLFNTNVVFDRNGAVIDRYRKIHLFGEFSRTPALKPDLGVFTTDFGVKFAHYICFDLQFQVPAVQVVDKLNVTDVIFTTMWFSEMPYLSAVQIQEGYAFAMDVNFIAAGANNVRFGSSGSGIFSGKAGALVSVMPGLPTTKLLVATVPKAPGQVTGPKPGPIYNNPEDHDSLTLITDPSLRAHYTRVLTPGLQQFTMSAGDIVCDFKVNMTENESEADVPYRAAVFDGIRSYSGFVTGGTRLCSIISCTGDTPDTCGRRFPQYAPKSTAIFHELNIIATVPTPRIDAELESRDTVYFPLSLDTSIMPLEPDYYTYSEDKNEEVTVYNLFLEKYDRELYSFAIWGRVFAGDGELEDPPLTEPTTLLSTETTEVSLDSTTTDIDADDDSSVSHLITKSLLIPVLLLLLK
ncbi:hypothetical protein evm_005094 [Chilo suppressalis]|nr:hypothetical protein evm_005094 [Chilo suppressalis]